MIEIPRAAKPRRTGRIRFIASLGVFAFVGVGVTAASVTDSAVATLSPVGGTLDIALADANGSLMPHGTVYAIPTSDIVGTIYPVDSPAAAGAAYIPVRVVNNSTGAIGSQVRLSLQNLAAAGALDVYSKLEVQIVDAADPGTPLLPWTPATGDTSVAFALNGTDARTRTLNVQLRLVSRDLIDGRYYGVPVNLGLTLDGESS